MIHRTICVSLAAAVWLSLGSFAHALESGTIRVAILSNAVMARVSIDGYYRIEDPATHEVFATGKDLRGAITAFKYAVNINGRRYRQKGLFIRIDDPRGLQVNGRRYSGHLGIIRSRREMTLVNYAGLEDYIRGIAVREISHYWPSEALRAHAIVFRTYAMYAMGQNASKQYDVTGDVYSQVYGGTAAERYRISDACAETAGDVLTYQGRIFPAYYHSTCGGHTEAAATLWNIDIPPLSGVDCAYCKGSPHFSWSAEVPVSEAAELLSKAGVKAQGISAVEALHIDRSGRITGLKLFLNGTGSVVIPAKDFRRILGADIVKSTNFSAEVRGDRIEFSGSGWGHGVGLCQWGAYFMAKAGYSCREILDHYYPGSEVKNIHTHGIHR